MSKQETIVASLLLKQGTASKVGPRSRGSVGYDVLCDTKETEVFLALTSNSDGGYYSRETVSVSVIESCLKSCKKDQPLPSKIFCTAFQGRSSNNGGFLAAVLRHEGLLSPVPNAVHQHLLAGKFSEWKEEMLSLPAKPYVPATASSGVTSEPKSSNDGDSGKRKGRKDADVWRELPTVLPGGAGDKGETQNADPATR